jgi:hypothetical protein
MSPLRIAWGAGPGRGLVVRDLAQPGAKARTDASDASATPIATVRDTPAGKCGKPATLDLRGQGNCLKKRANSRPSPRGISGCDLKLLGPSSLSKNFAFEHEGAIRRLIAARYRRTVLHLDGLTPSVIPRDKRLRSNRNPEVPMRIVFSLLTVLLVSSAALASGEVCKAKGLVYSVNRSDGGANIASSYLLVLNGKELIKDGPFTAERKRLANIDFIGQPFSVGKPTVKENYESTRFKQRAKVLELDPTTGNEVGAPLFSGTVSCVNERYVGPPRP